MKESLFAIMYDIGPIPPDNPDHAGSRRYELDIVKKGPVEHGVEKTNDVITRSEHVLRVGYREVPSEASIAAYAQHLIGKYDAEIDVATEQVSHIKTLLFRGDQRPVARQLLLEERFTLD